MTLTVIDTGATAADRMDGTGEQVETGVVIDDDCQYDWSAGFVGANGAACQITEASLAPPVTESTITLVVSNICVTMGNLVVTVRATGTEASCTDVNNDNGVVDGDDVPCGDGLMRTLTSRTMTSSVESTQTERDSGAVENTVFTVTATPQEDARGNVPTECPP